VINNPINASDPTGNYCVGDIEGCLDEVGGNPVNGGPLYLHSENRNGGNSGGPDDDICTNFYECVPDCNNSEWGCSPDISWTLEDWPAITFAFAIPCLATGLCETIATAGSAAYEMGFWRTVAACLGNAVCRWITGTAGGAGSIPRIWTPYGYAYQEYTDEALQARELVSSGAPLYKWGTLGNSNISGSQFWSLQNPILTPGYVADLGIPAENVIGDQFLAVGQTVTGNFITRAAPAMGNNPGGAIEVVTDFYCVVLISFSMTC
jgi:hypothetical protein